MTLTLDVSGLQVVDDVSDEVLLAEAKAPAVNGASVMIAFYPSMKLARKLAVDPDVGLEASDMHVTLAFLGDKTPDWDMAKLRAVVAGWAAATAPFKGLVSGRGLFVGGDDPVTYASFDIPHLGGEREALATALRGAGFPPSTTHGFTPHMTIAYADLPDWHTDAEDVAFDKVSLVVGGRREDFRLTGADDLREAEDKHPRWPAGTPGGLGGEFMKKGDVSKLPSVSVANMAVGAHFVSAKGVPYKLIQKSDSTEWAKAINLKTGKPYPVKQHKEFHPVPEAAVVALLDGEQPKTTPDAKPSVPDAAPPAAPPASGTIKNTGTLDAMPSGSTIGSDTAKWTKSDDGKWYLNGDGDEPPIGFHGGAFADMVSDGTLKVADTPPAPPAPVESFPPLGYADSIGSPGRGPTGKLRNFKSMGDAKLKLTIKQLESYKKDPEALAAAKDAAAAKGLDLGGPAPSIPGPPASDGKMPQAGKFYSDGKNTVKVTEATPTMVTAHIVQPDGSLSTAPVSAPPSHHLWKSSTEVPEPKPKITSASGDAVVNGGFQAYGSKYGPGGKYQHDPIGKLEAGEEFVDKTGKAWQVVTADPVKPTITDGLANYTIDGTLRGKLAIHVKGGGKAPAKVAPAPKVTPPAGFVPQEFGVLEPTLKDGDAVWFTTGQKGFVVKDPSGGGFHDWSVSWAADDGSYTGTGPLTPMKDWDPFLGPPAPAAPATTQSGMVETTAQPKLGDWVVFATGNGSNVGKVTEDHGDKVLVSSLVHDTNADPQFVETHMVDKASLDVGNFVNATSLEADLAKVNGKDRAQTDPLSTGFPVGSWVVWTDTAGNPQYGHVSAHFGAAPMNTVQVTDGDGNAHAITTQALAKSKPPSSAPAPKPGKGKQHPVNGAKVKDLNLAVGDIVQPNKGGWKYTLTEPAGVSGGWKAVATNGSTKVLYGLKAVHGVQKADGSVPTLKDGVNSVTPPAAPAGPTVASLKAALVTHQGASFDALPEGTVFTTLDGKLAVLDPKVDAYQGYITAWTEAGAKVEVPKAAKPNKASVQPVPGALALLKAAAPAAASPSSSSSASSSAPKKSKTSVTDDWKHLANGAQSKSKVAGWQAGTQNKLSSEQKDALKGYTDGTYSKINNALREESLDVFTLQDVQRLDSVFDVIDGIPEDIITHRGTHLSALTGEVAVGKVIYDRGFMSTSPTKPWSKEVVLHIRLKKGSKALWGPTTGGDVTAGEDEIILRRSTMMQVLQVEDVGGVKHIYVEAYA